MKKLMIVDSHAIAHTAKHRTKGYHKNGSETGIIHGFLERVLSTINIIKPDNIVFSWDNRNSKRRKIYPKYKIERVELRKTDEYELHKMAMKQFNILREEIIPAFGFVNSFSFDGYEADDIAGKIVRNNVEYKIVLVTRDSDWYQLLGANTKLWNISSMRYYTQKNLLEDHGMTTDEFVMAKALSYVKGIQLATARKFLHNDLKEESKAYKSIELDWLAVNTTYFDLCYLPFDNCPDINIEEWSGLDIDSIEKILNKYSFQDMSADEWAHVLPAPF